MFGDLFYYGDPGQNRTGDLPLRSSINQPLSAESLDIAAFSKFNGINKSSDKLLLIAINLS